MLVIPGHAYLQRTALDTNRPNAAVSPNEGVPHFRSFAKYAVAFPRMSRSIFTRANSARNRLISICSALTSLVSAPRSLPSPPAFTQLCSVCATTPSVRDALARLSPDSTSPIASCLNSSVYFALYCLFQLSLFADSQLRDTFSAGKVSRSSAGELQESALFAPQGPAQGHHQ